MTKTNLYFLSAFIGLLTYINNTNSFLDECSGKVGDVKYSYLSEDAFISVNGDCWVLLAGQPFSSDFELYKKIVQFGTPQMEIPNNLPDAQGLFIRGMDFQGNVDPGRQIGTKQKQSTAKPGKNFFGLTGKIDRKGITQWSDLDKDENFNASWLMNTINGQERRVLDGLHTHQYDHHSHGRAKHGDNANYRETLITRNPDKRTGRDVYSSSYGEGHYHEVIIYRGGDKETRPANLSFYTYLRVD